MKVTGERIVTREGAFNASWQRHAACYSLSAATLGPGSVLDVGCGLGHAYEHLAPRASIGVDVHLASLTGQDRPVVAADMRRLPFRDGSFESILCIHAIEHVRDPQNAVRECARVLEEGGTAIFVTPNRLTFGRPDEIIDPYHFVEFDPEELRALCKPSFGRVQIMGLFGSAAYMEFYAAERRRLNALLRMDPMRLRRFVPRGARQWLYDWQLTRSRMHENGPASLITTADFELRAADLDQALDLFAICG